MEFLKSHLDRRHPEQVSRPDKEISKYDILDFNYFCVISFFFLFLSRNSQEELETRLLQQMMDHLHASEKQLRDEMKQKVTNKSCLDSSACLKAVLIYK